VSNAVLAPIAVAGRGDWPAQALPPPSLRGVVAGAVRRTLGHKESSALRRSYSSAERERRRVGKAFDARTVNAILQRLNAASVDRRRFVARPAANPRMRWMISGASLQLAEAN